MPARDANNAYWFNKSVRWSDLSVVIAFELSDPLTKHKASVRRISV